MEKYNEMQLTQHKMDMNNRQIKNHPPSPIKVHKCRQPKQELDARNFNRALAECTIVIILF